MFAGSDETVSALRRAGFRALRAGQSPAIDALAAAAGLSGEEAASALTELIERGVATVDHRGRLDGIAGLTRRASRHAIEMDGERLHTWCAFDAVGIPAAFRWTADALTRCRHCGAHLRVRLRGGVPVSPGPWGWLPPADCEHILRDFCVAADLYCSREHLEAWRAVAGNPPGQPASLQELAETGRQSWADCAGEVDR